MRSAGTSFEFGAFRLEPDERRLCRGREPIAITPKAFDLLVILVENADRLLKKEDLRERLWPGTFVEEVNLAQNVSAIRRALGGGGRDAYIQTVAGTGYRFVATVRRPPERPVDQQAAPADEGVAPRFDRERLLVLPFRMLKADPDLDFLAFSLPDALTASLASLDSLIVRPSLIAARFAGDAPDHQRIAREAQVDLVVSGTLLRAGDQLRVSAQLSDACAGTLIWSHTAQAPVEDLFQLQDSLVERIVGSLSRPLSAPERRQLRHDVPATAKAYEYFLRANQANPSSAVSLESVTVARDWYLKSVEEDPGYAPAWTRLARTYRLLGKYRTEDAAANVARADEALQRALALNPDLSMAHNLFAQIEVDRGRAERAMVSLLERLRRRGPHAEVFAGLVQACRFCGLYDASTSAHAHAHRLDPALGTSVMHTYFVTRRYEDVVAVSGDVKGYVFALSLAALGRGAEALAVVAPTMPLFVAARTLIEGKRAESLEALAEAARTMSDPEACYYVARHFAHLDQPRLALDFLSKSIGGGYSCFAPLTQDPWLESLRNEPEFQALVSRARERHDSAAAAFRRAGGPVLLDQATAS
jgi:DNA-binding winged helix-turn-helix (wHTH) protein